MNVQTAKAWMDRLRYAATLVRRGLSKLSHAMDHEGRSGEWEHAWLFAAMMFITLLPGDTLRYGMYATVRDIGFNETVVGIFLACMSSFRIGALVVNGFFMATPHVRAATSFLSCLFFSGLSFLVWAEYWSADGVQTAGWVMGIFPVLAAFELRAAGRIRRERERNALATTH